MRPRDLDGEDDLPAAGDEDEEEGERGVGLALI